MPIYAYKCSACGFAKDVLQKLSDAPLTDCPQCGAGTFSKQVTAAGFQLKGSGWYVTDFRDGGGKKAGEKGAEKGSADTATAAPAEGAAASTGTTDAPAAAASPAPAQAPAPAAPKSD
ncbi:FmdB family zinc ribbon protein [Variovorax soli]|uniref:FmdB family regulatory protein n=1 Tax=Variovorax soli TaxID=376815 RepID=A0ABU1NG10_9BURK|nr:FmdB family zinc ribbon protein [Variovorax soli]MDR6537364.1 putative FmdB family regulatory protein [Variovorax soli]